MQRFLIIAIFALILGTSKSGAQDQPFVVPAIITNHYDASEPESHGVITVLRKRELVAIAVRDLSKNKEYQVALLNESSGKRSPLGSFTTDSKGGALKEFFVPGLLDAYNALLILRENDVVQYAQLQEAHHGCICRHSGGTIVTRRLDQECYECPCGVKYEICCGGPKQ